MVDSNGEAILVVDDEEFILTLVQRSFERMGHLVFVAQSGPEALEVYRKRSQEIAGVILDLSMPEMSGEETFDALRQVDPDVKVIFSSGYSESDVSARMREQGLVGIIQKPFRPIELVEKARNLFELSTPKK